jgi:hypothetical protein
VVVVVRGVGGVDVVMVVGGLGHGRDGRRVLGGAAGGEKQDRDERERTHVRLRGCYGSAPMGWIEIRYNVAGAEGLHFEV